MSYTATELSDIASGNSVKRTEVELFCIENNITEGEYKNDDKIIYWEYLKWCYKLNRTSIDRASFKRELQKQFKRYTAKDSLYYKFNVKLTVTEEEWDAILHDYFVEKELIAWQKRRKKQQEISQRLRRKREKKQAKEARKRKKVKSDTETPKTSG